MGELVDLTVDDDATNYSSRHNRQDFRESGSRVTDWRTVSDDDLINWRSYDSGHPRQTLVQPPLNALHTKRYPTQTAQDRSHHGVAVKRDGRGDQETHLRRQRYKPYESKSGVNQEDLNNGSTNTFDANAPSQFKRPFNQLSDSQPSQSQQSPQAKRLRPWQFEERASREHSSQSTNSPLVQTPSILRKNPFIEHIDSEREEDDLKEVFDQNAFNERTGPEREWDDTRGHGPTQHVPRHRLFGISGKLHQEAPFPAETSSQHEETEQFKGNIETNAKEAALKCQKYEKTNGKMPAAILQERSKIRDVEVLYKVKPSGDCQQRPASEDESLKDPHKIGPNSGDGFDQRTGCGLLLSQDGLDEQALRRRFSLQLSDVERPKPSNFLNVSAAETPNEPRNAAEIPAKEYPTEPTTASGPKLPGGPSIITQPSNKYAVKQPTPTQEGKKADASVPKARTKAPKSTAMGSHRSFMNSMKTNKLLYRRPAAPVTSLEARATASAATINSTDDVTPATWTTSASVLAPSGGSTTSRAKPDVQRFSVTVPPAVPPKPPSPVQNEHKTSKYAPVAQMVPISQNGTSNAQKQTTAPPPPEQPPAIQTPPAPKSIVYDPSLTVSEKELLDRRLNQNAKFTELIFAWQELTGEKLSDRQIQRKYQSLLEKAVRGGERLPAKAPDITATSNTATSNTTTSNTATSAPHDEPTESPQQQRPTTGGKKWNPEVMQAMIERLREEQDEEDQQDVRKLMDFREDSPLTDEDYNYWEYSVWRKTWHEPDNEGTTENPWVACGYVGCSLVKANLAASREAATERDGIGPSYHASKSHIEYLEDGRYTHMIQLPWGGFRVQVSRHLRTNADGKPPDQKFGWFRKNLYQVYKKTTITAAPLVCSSANTRSEDHAKSDHDELFDSPPPEAVHPDTTADATKRTVDTVLETQAVYTILGQANKDAADLVVDLTTNAHSKKIDEYQKRVDALRKRDDELERLEGEAERGGGLYAAAFELGEKESGKLAKEGERVLKAEVEVRVVEVKMVGPRNI